MMTIANLERKLTNAQKRLRIAVQALTAKHEGGEWENYRSAYSELLATERELAAAKDQPYAVPLDFPVRWDVGAPIPHLFQNDTCVLLTFYVSVPNPAWDGTQVEVKSSSDNVVESLALVEFVGCVATFMGTPNDEVFKGHPLSGKGLEPYTAQVVQNSEWQAQLETINQVHRHYSRERWHTLKHYAFWFHDCTFECIAQSYKLETFQMTMTDLAALAVKRLLT